MKKHSDEQQWNDSVDRFLSLPFAQDVRDKVAGPHYREPGRRTLEDGVWLGCYAQPTASFSPQWMTVEVRRTSGEDSEDERLSSEGNDPIGAFTFSGVFARSTGYARLSKRYTGKHEVHYAGVLRAEVLRGCWSIPGYGDGLFAFVHANSIASATAAALRERAHERHDLRLQLLALLTSPVRFLSLYRHSSLCAQWRELYPELHEFLQR